MMKNNTLVCLIIVLSLATARAQDCSNIFTVYRGFSGLYAEVIKSGAHLEPVLRMEVTMSVALALQGVNFIICVFLARLIKFANLF